MTLRRALAITAIALLMNACSGSSDATAPTTTRAAATTTTTDSPADGSTTTTTIPVPTTTAPTTTTAPETALTEIELAVSASDRPVDGAAASPIWADVVRSLDEYMERHDIGAGTLTISLDGEPALEVALGWRDLARTEALDRDAAFRVASVTKPYTKALAMEMIAAGAIDPFAQVLCVRPSDECVLDETDRATGEIDERLADIDLYDLLDHVGGFDRQQFLDPMFAPLLISDELGLEPVDTLPELDDVIAWLLTQPLQHQPGERFAYSNVGYALAGAALETAGDDDYLTLLQQYVLGPTGTEQVSLGSMAPVDRRADEVEYRCDDADAFNVFDPSGPGGCDADVGFVIELMDAHGGLVASAPAVVEFLDDFCVDGSRNGEFGCGSQWHDGSLPGTYAIARNFGRVNYSVLFNQRSAGSGSQFNYVDLVDVLDVAITDALGESPLA